MLSNPSEKELEECPTHGQWVRVIYDPERATTVAQPMCPACRKEALARSLLRRAAISPRFLHCSFKNYRVLSDDHQTALTACHGYADDFRRMHGQGVCMVLRGGPGTGKNHLATAMARQVMGLGYSVLMLTVNELIQRVRETWDRQAPETEAEVIRRFAETDLLILDEVGRQYGSESEKIILFQLLDARYRSLRPSVIISNLPADEIAVYLGEAVYDRLREGGGRLINFDWASYRR